MTAPAPCPVSVRGFTLVELMVSLALIAVIALILVSITNSTAATWRYTTGRIEQFRGANTAFESISRRLSQATLNTYWDYEYPNGDKSKVPTQYVRQSDLRFITGKTDKLVGSTTPRRPTHGIFFQAPLGYVEDVANFSGLDNLLNTWGYYVEFNSDEAFRPTFIPAQEVPPRWRYRLMELMQASNTLSIYSFTSGKPTYDKKDWFINALKPPTTASATPAYHVLAENVIGLALLPKLSKKEEALAGQPLSSDYTYDSTQTKTPAAVNPKNQLPPIVQVTLIAIDELSAGRIAEGASLPAFDAALDGLFTDSAKLTEDLASLQTTLGNQKIGYRIFTNSVSIRGAKWSTK